MSHDAPHLMLRAFPSELSADAERAADCLIPQKSEFELRFFSVCVMGEQLHLPERVYFAANQWRPATYSTTQIAMIDCIFTRHHDGFEREKCVRRIVGLNQAWSVPYVLALVGDYVAEIVVAIYDNREHLDAGLCGEFISANPLFMGKVHQRVRSYWHRYHRGRWPDFQEYPGCKLLKHVDGVA